MHKAIFRWPQQAAIFLFALTNCTEKQAVNPVDSQAAVAPNSLPKSQLTRSFAIRMESTSSNSAISKDDLPVFSDQKSLFIAGELIASRTGDGSIMFEPERFNDEGRKMFPQRIDFDANGPRFDGKESSLDAKLKSQFHSAMEKMREASKESEKRRQIRVGRTDWESMSGEEIVTELKRDGRTVMSLGNNRYQVTTVMKPTSQSKLLTLVTVFDASIPRVERAEFFKDGRKASEFQVANDVKGDRYLFSKHYNISLTRTEKHFIVQNKLPQ